MWKLIAVLALASCVAVNAQDEEYWDEGTTGYILPVTDETVEELGLDEVVFPDGYEWLVISLQQVNLPELSVEQLAELEEQMTEEHFNFLLNMMDDIKYASTPEDFYDYGDGSTTFDPLVFGEDDEEREWWNQWITSTERAEPMPELPDERQIMDKGWNPEVYSYQYRHTRLGGVPLWAVITLPIAGLALIVTAMCACCRKSQRRPANGKYLNFENEPYMDEKKVPIV